MIDEAEDSIGVAKVAVTEGTAASDAVSRHETPTAPRPDPTATRPGGQLGQSWGTLPVAPWRRYGARTLDTLTSGVAGFILIGIVWYQIAPLSADAFFSIFESKAGRLVDLFVTLIVAGLVNAIVMGATGTTIGKLVFGIRIAGRNGARLGFAECFRREADVWVRGLGFGMPIVSLITMTVAYQTLTKRNTTSWDADRHEVLYRQNGAQVWLNVLGVVLIIAARYAANALGEL